MIRARSGLGVELECVAPAEEDVPPAEPATAAAEDVDPEALGGGVCAAAPVPVVAEDAFDALTVARALAFSSAVEVAASALGLVEGPSGTALTSASPVLPVPVEGVAAPAEATVELPEPCCC